MIVRYQLVHLNAKVPTQATEGSAGWDLYLPQNMYIDRDITGKMSLGFRMAIPFGWEATIRPRSSLSLRGIRLVNSPATIDSDYRGEVCIAFQGIETVLKSGERVAQMLFSEVPLVRWEEAGDEGLSYTVRGGGGFGSTGK